MALAGAALNFATCGGALDVLAAGVEVGVTGNVVDIAGGACSDGVAAGADVLAAGIVVGPSIPPGLPVPEPSYRPRGFLRARAI